MVRPTTAQICSEIDPTTPNPSFAKEGKNSRQNHFAFDSRGPQARRDGGGGFTEAYEADGRVDATHKSTPISFQYPTEIAKATRPAAA